MRGREGSGVWEGQWGLGNRSGYDLFLMLRVGNMGVYQSFSKLYVFYVMYFILYVFYLCYIIQSKMY